MNDGVIQWVAKPVGSRGLAWFFGIRFGNSAMEAASDWLSHRPIDVWALQASLGVKARSDLDGLVHRHATRSGRSGLVSLVLCRKRRPRWGPNGSLDCGFHLAPIDKVQPKLRLRRQTHFTRLGAHRKVDFVAHAVVVSFIRNALPV
jgi:hypothetical protein